MCTSGSTGRDSALGLDLRCQVLICTKIKVALELSFAENGGSIIFTVLELQAVKTCYVEPSC